MVLIDVKVEDDTISVTLPDGRNAKAAVSAIQKKRDIRPI